METYYRLDALEKPLRAVYFEDLRRLSDTEISGKMLYCAYDNGLIESFDQEPFTMKGQMLFSLVEPINVEDKQALQQLVVNEQSDVITKMAEDSLIAYDKARMDAEDEFVRRYYLAQIPDLDTFLKVDDVIDTHLIQKERQEEIANDINVYRDLKFGDYNKVLLQYHQTLSSSSFEDEQVQHYQHELDGIRQCLKEIEMEYPTLQEAAKEAEETYGAYVFSSPAEALAFANYLKEERLMTQRTGETEYLRVTLADAEKVDMMWYEEGQGQLPFTEVFMEPDFIEGKDGTIQISGYVQYGVKPDGTLQDCTALPEPIDLRGDETLQNGVQSVFAKGQDDLGQKITEMYGYTLESDAPDLTMNQGEGLTM